MTTACQPSGGCRTISASGATPPCITIRTSPRRPKPDPKKQIAISRPNFIELCEQLVEEDEKAFEALWRTLGLSVDWTQTYTTIGDKSRKVSQTAFLRNLARGEAYLQEAPTLWDITFQTAVAQAELEAREYPRCLSQGRLPQA
jgi:valyl-tRNA synthetase